MTEYIKNKAQKVKISSLQVGDIVVDSDGLLQEVKAIQPQGKNIAVTTNYLERGFYQAADSTKIVKSSAWCYTMKRGETL